MSDPTYPAMHKRVRAAHGPAWRHLCRHCLARYAENWAYDHNDPNEITDRRGRVYSTDVQNYLPLCCGCHRRFDAPYRPEQPRDERGRFTAPAPRTRRSPLNV